jgi:molybdate transport system substrate-binding protein
MVVWKTKKKPAIGLLFALGLGIAASASAADVPASADSPKAARGRELVVFAAASLKEAFERIAKDFEEKHPGVRVALQLAGSQELRTQLENGAKADVFASADTRHMSALADADLVRKPEIFARNEPVLIVPAANPAGVERFAELAKAKRLVVGTPEVPIGNYTNQILANAAKQYGHTFAKRVEANIASRELNVRQILAKVSLGEADAGFVYRTDATAGRNRVRVIEIPPALNVAAEYPIAVVSRAPNPDLAQEWVDLVLSPRGQRVLGEAGFPVRKTFE